MKFSVLLPTRNRLNYLKYAIETVRRQDYQDWEIVVSDNFSEEDIVGYVRSLGDSRIKYYRTASFVPVTDNWNNALERSTGDYVIMLGDDDGLMKGYFTRVNCLLADYPSPDLIYTGAFVYAYPGVMPDYPDGYLQRDRNRVFNSEKPFWLDRRQALNLVRQSMSFRMLFAYNMQFSIISRRLIERAVRKGRFFQSPYPDFYATNAMLLTADRILISPQPMVIIGITPKSYGFFHFNKNEQSGIEFLQNWPDPGSAERLQHLLLPGSNNTNSWLFAMEALKSNYGQEFGLRVNYRRYRWLQILNVYKNYYLDRRLSSSDLKSLTKRMRMWERLVYGMSLWLLFSTMSLVPWRPSEAFANRLRTLLGQYVSQDAQDRSRKLKNILDVFEAVEIPDA